MSERWQTAWVTGATSGIGREIALELARGGTRVAGSGRREEELHALRDESGGMVVPHPLDVTDDAAVAACVEAVEAGTGPIDLAVLSAGVWTPFSMRDWKVENFARSMDVNYLGVVRALAVLVPRMTARGRGHIAIVASVAGYVGLVKAETYGPTKAALINLAEGLATELKGTGVTVSLINPGFVDTPMTRTNSFPMPFLLAPDVAAKRAVAGLRTGRFEVVFPRRLAYALKLVRLLPYQLFFPLMSRTVGRRR